jgi:transposase
MPMRNPFAGPNSTLIMDNFTFHHHGRVEAIAEARECRLIYLPPYCMKLYKVEMTMLCLL